MPFTVSERTARANAISPTSTTSTLRPERHEVLYVDTVYDSAGNSYRSAISLANVETDRVTRLTQR
jgi:hypothetical protein